MKESNVPKRTVTAPSTSRAPGTDTVLSVELGPDEDVQWVWSHDRERGSRVTGYVVVPRKSAGMT